MIDWEDAIEIAKSELGYDSGEYIHDFNRVVDLAYDICSDEALIEYQQFLKSDKWKKIRAEVMKRDSYLCRYCAKPATEVHHVTYEFGWEVACYCKALCRECHEREHQIKKIEFQ